METFDQIIHSDAPVVVDFYADWCGPCKAMAPVLKDAAEKLSGKARIIKINIDKNEATARHYAVQSVPTFIIFKNGKVLWRHAGMIGGHELVQQALSFAR